MRSSTRARADVRARGKRSRSKSGRRAGSGIAGAASLGRTLRGPRRELARSRAGAGVRTNGGRPRHSSWRSPGREDSAACTFAEHRGAEASGAGASPTGRPGRTAGSRRCFRGRGRGNDRRAPARRHGLRTITAAVDAVSGTGPGSAAGAITQGEVRWGSARVELVAAGRPLVLAFEDLHWADPALHRADRLSRSGRGADAHPRIGAAGSRLSLRRLSSSPAGGGSSSASAADAGRERGARRRAARRHRASRRRCVGHRRRREIHSSSRRPCTCSPTRACSTRTPRSTGAGRRRVCAR